MRRGAISLLAGAMLTLGFSTPAAAVHYYAIGTFSSDATSYGGGHVQIQIQSLFTDNCAAIDGHINQTIWVGTDNSVGSTAQYWAEVGYTYGYRGSCSKTYYWARNNPINGYADFALWRIDGDGTYHTFEVQEITSAEYDVYIDSNLIGADVNAHPVTHWVETGLEYTSTASTLSQTPFDWHQLRYADCLRRCTWIYWPSGDTYNTPGAPHTYVWTTPTPPFNHAYDTN